ncbi:MAG: hypothetical protein ABI904_08730 [Chloroflexota bacterium]
MTRDFNRPALLPSLILTLVLTLFPAPVHAYSAIDLPPLNAFIEQVSNGEADVLRGIYVPGVFADLVSPQPTGEAAFISSNEDTLTQFGLASRYGSTGLLAHNRLAGKNFFFLGEGRLFYLIYGDGRIETFVVTQLQRFQALDPENVYSKFVDLHTGDLLTAAGLFMLVYAQPGKVILQTCIDAHGNPSWGRLFVIAEPYRGDDLATNESD